MPSSFSRFLADDELRRVRELYLKSLEDFAEDKGANGEPADGTAAEVEEQAQSGTTS